MPTLHKIAVKKGSQGFGFILSNQSPCVVSSVIDGGPAEIASLKPGDEILEVNSKNVSRSTHEQVVRLILKTSGKWVSLKVRRYSDSADLPNDYVDLADDNNEFHKSIIETVDKVVEDLKSGNLFQSPNFSPNGQPATVKKERYAVPMDQYENLEGISSSRASSYAIQNISNDDNDGRSVHDSMLLSQSEIITGDGYKAVVGYLRTVELPSGPSLTSSSLDAIKNVSSSMHLTSKKINKRLLMIISLEGIKLVYPEGNDIRYPASSLAFICLCPEDNRFFGIVTKKVLNENHRLSKVYNSKMFNAGSLHSCHIFMVDTEFCSHSRHENLSRSFGLSCTHDISTDTCKEFPLVSTDIVYALKSLLRVQTGTDDMSDSPTGCSTPPMKKEIDNLAFEQCFSDSLGMLQKLRIDEELKAQSQAENEDSDLELDLLEGASEQYILNSKLSNVAKNNTTASDEDTPAVHSYTRTIFNLSSHLDAFGNLSPTQNPSLCNPSITDRFQDDTASQSVHSNEVAMKDNEGQNCLEHLLKNSARLRSFENFLKKEHSEENIMFWKACEMFKTLDDPCQLRKMAIEIYHTYLAHGAPGLVNVDQQAVKKAEEKLISPDANMFNLQQKQIFMLMKYDCFPRYLKSEFNQHCLTQESQESPEEDLDTKEYKKRKTHWYLKKLKVNWKESTAKDSVEPGRKRSILGILSKNKGQKQDSKSRVTKASDSISSENDSKQAFASPTLAEELKFYMPKSPMEIKEFLGSSSQFCRVILPNGSSTVLMPEPGKSIRQLLENYCSRQNLPLSSDDVFVDEEDQSVDMDEESLSFGDRVIHLLRKVQFRFDLPSKRSVAVRDSPIKTIFEVVEPIMRKNGYNIKNFEIRMAKEDSLVQLDSKISAIENKHVVTATSAKSNGSSNVPYKPPASKGALKLSQSSFDRARKSSKDDSSLQSNSIIGQTSKSQDAFNRFLRRGSLEGALSFIKSKQSLRSSLKNITTNTSVVNAKGKQNNRKIQDGTNAVSKTEFSKAEKETCQPMQMGISENKPTSSNRSSKNAQKENMQRSQMNIGKFRPSSEVFPKAQDSFIDEFSKSNNTSTHHLNLYPAVSDPEIQLQKERSRSKSPKKFFNRGNSEIFISSKNSVDFTNRNGGQALNKGGQASSKADGSRPGSGTSQQRKLSKNLLTWRARDNSCDSASSSATEEHDSCSNKKFSRGDTKRNSPQSPRSKHQKVEIKEPEIEIANSPIFPVDSGGQKQKKPRPTPITGINESDILLGLDPGDYPAQASNEDFDQTEMDDSFEFAIEKNLALSKNHKAATADEFYSTGENISNDEIKGQDIMVSSCNNEVIATATGSVNDETLIMEDKDTGFDLFGLMDVTNAKKNRRGVRQKTGDKDARLKADHAITFV